MSEVSIVDLILVGIYVAVGLASLVILVYAILDRVKQKDREKEENIEDREN